MDKLKLEYEKLLEEVKCYRENMEKLKLIFEASNEGMWVMDLEGNMQFFNTGFYEKFDINPEDSTLDEWVKLVHPEDKRLFSENVSEQVNKTIDFFTTQYRVVTREGDEVWIDAVGLAKFDRDNQMEFMVGSHTDVTKRKEIENKLYYMAYHDTLTDLLTRERITEILDEAITRGDVGTLFHINIKQFKMINDVNGHAFGDEVLVLLAERLKALEGNHTYVSRITADQFLIYIQGQVEEAVLHDHAQRLLSTIREKINLHGRSLELDAGVGIVRFPQDGDCIETLLQNANLTAMYAKENAKQSYLFYNKADQAEVLRNLRIENYLKFALNHNELYIDYQPIVCLKKNAVSGFEALVRWHNKDLGNIPPNVFIPLAEKNDAIINIGHFVLEQACRFGVKLNNVCSKDTRMSVNISVMQLLQDQFPEMVQDVLTTTGFNPYNLDLEITESMILESNPTVIRNLGALRRMGICISLDDFGTGYSSIHNLLNLPLTQLKLDQSIVRKSQTNEDITALIQSVVYYAHVKNMKVVIEGVENKEMLDKAHILQGDYAQGYFYSKPMREEAVEMFLKCSNLIDLN